MARPAVPQGGAAAIAHTRKRKPADQPDAVAGLVKRPRPNNTGLSSAQQRQQQQPVSLSLQPLDGFVADLQPKYEVKTLSVLSSTSIAKRVDTILQHLGRFHPWDPSVLPGVVLLYARSGAANKLITIAETVRRRVHEGEQKWYQYNRLYEMEWAVEQSRAAKEDSGRGGGGGDADAGGEGDDENDGDDDDYFETMNTAGQTGGRTQFERAVHGEQKARQVTHMSIFLSRVPVPELKARDNFTMQSNEDQIDHIRRKKAGLA